MNNFRFSQLKTLKDVQKELKLVLQGIRSGSEQFNKSYTQQLIDALYIQLNSNQSSSISKLMTLHVLKQLTYYGQWRFFSLLSTHQIIQYFFIQASTVDPKKNVKQKGKYLFANQPNVGVQYMNLLLELIHFWGEKLARNKYYQITRFKKLLAQLKNMKVVMPVTYRHIDITKYTPKPKKYSTISNENNAHIENSRINHKLTLQLRYTRDKINTFITQLQDSSNSDKIQNIIVNNHIYLQKQKKKYQDKAQQIQNFQLIIDIFFQIDHFITQQNKFYNHYILNKDAENYISKIVKVYQQTFQKVSKWDANNIKSQFVKSSNSNNNQIKNKRNPHSSQIINAIYQRLTSKSKSPDVGFKAVGLELEKKKISVKKYPPKRPSQSKSPNRSSGIGKITQQNASMSYKIHPIFANPPNREVHQKNYEGQLLMSNRELARVLYDVKKQQGSRRFKVSNFRQKNPLFQNQHIQVGYKSQAVYQRIGEFNHFILLSIYIGNKTQVPLKQFHIQYKADTNQLLFANPRVVDEIIGAGYQYKYQLMITPIYVPYCFMTMHLKYKYNNSQIYTGIVLPNSVIKYVSYMKISYEDFVNGWKNSKKYRTSNFRLCKYLPPDSFNRWIPLLQPLTQYKQYSKLGSEIDLQMYCMIIMLQKYEGVLKINIRPNLQVIIQIGIIENNQESLEYFKFYLQTLQLILKQTDL